MAGFYSHQFTSLSDYVGFIKKVMKQMQKGYNEIQALEIELKILETTSAPPSRPRKYPLWSLDYSVKCMMRWRLMAFLMITLLSTSPGLLVMGWILDYLRCIYEARAGHLIYCYGNCNRDIDTNDPAAVEEDSGEDLVKKFWLDAIERPCDQSKLHQQRRRPTNKRLFTVRFCE